MRVAISTIALLACTSLASAADLGGPYQYEGSIKDGPIAAQYNWSGLYFGGHVGWATGGWDGNMAYSDAASIEETLGWVFDGSSKSFDADGWLGGLQIGFNRQHGAFVWGIEADISWPDLSEEKRLMPYPNETIPPAWDIGLKLDYFGTLRGRIGFLVTPRLLLFGTGGLAWAKTSIDQEVVYLNPPQSQIYEGGVATRGSGDETHFGWAAGLGGEYMIANNWTVRAEWVHVDLGKEDYNITGVNTLTPNAVSKTDSFPAELTFDVFRLGVNYKFGH